MHSLTSCQPLMMVDKFIEVAPSDVLWNNIDVGRSERCIVI